MMTGGTGNYSKSAKAAYDNLSECEKNKLQENVEIVTKMSKRQIKNGGKIFEKIKQLVSKFTNCLDV